MKKSEVERKVRDQVMPLVEQRDLQLVDVEYVKEGGSYHLRVYVDRPGGVTIEDCQGISKELGRLLDLGEAPKQTYYLEVSSPGLDRPLKTDRDYEIFRGRLVEIKTYAPFDGKKTFTGKLMGLEEGVVILEKANGQTMNIPKSKVAGARLAVEF